MLGVLKNYYECQNRKCYFCNLDFGDRIVEENDDFICYIPADGKFAYGMDILPKNTSVHYQNLLKVSLPTLAQY